MSNSDLKCNCCKKYLSEQLFGIVSIGKRKGLKKKTCTECLERRKCKHERAKNVCKECGGYKCFYQNTKIRNTRTLFQTKK